MDLFKAGKNSTRFFAHCVTGARSIEIQKKVEDTAENRDPRLPSGAFGLNLFIDGPIKVTKSKAHSIYDVFSEIGGFCVSVTSVLTIISTFYINKQYNIYVARKIRRQLI